MRRAFIVAFMILMLLVACTSAQQPTGHVVQNTTDTSDPLQAPPADAVLVNTTEPTLINTTKSALFLRTRNLLKIDITRRSASKAN